MNRISQDAKKFMEALGDGIEDALIAEGVEAGIGLLV